MFENREKIRFIKNQLKLIAQYRKLYKFNERRNMALSMGTSKEFFLKPFLGYKLTATVKADEKMVINGEESTVVTLLHIYYNQLRETNRYHLGSKEADDKFALEQGLKYLIDTVDEYYKKELINA